VAEEEVFGDGGTESGELVGGLLVVGWLPVAVSMRGWSQRFGGDGGPARHVVVVWETLLFGTWGAEGRRGPRIGGGGAETEIGCGIEG